MRYKSNGGAGRQAITPDLAYEPRMHGGGGERRLVLLDLKGLRYSSINYPSAALDFMAARTGRRARTGFRSAVRRREDRVVTDYQRHAREVDRRLAERGYEGGVADYLATFIRDKRLRGVVFGSFNEGSPNMHQLLREVAREQAAARCGGRLGREGMQTTSPSSPHRPVSPLGGGLRAGQCARAYHSLAPGGLTGTARRRGGRRRVGRPGRSRGVRGGQQAAVSARRPLPSLLDGVSE